MSDQNTITAPPPITRPDTIAKCLTICQPWAWAIMAGHKRCENREWNTKYRGPLGIHAGKSKAWIEAGEEFILSQGFLVPPDLPYGFLLGYVDLIDVVRPAVARDKYHCGEWASGPWCFILANPRPLENPIALRGQMGLFSAPRK
jgi:hypothetical protein